MVSCSVTDNNYFSDIKIALISREGLRCVEGYEFMLGNEMKMVVGNPASAIFTVDKSLGMPYINQKIDTFDAENRRGSVPCLYNITGELETSILQHGLQHEPMNISKVCMFLYRRKGLQLNHIIFSSLRIMRKCISSFI